MGLGPDDGRDDAALMSDLDPSSTAPAPYSPRRVQTHPQERQLPGTNDRGQIFVAFMVVISIAWVPIIVEMQGGQMYLYIQEVADYLTPPVAALFLLAFSGSAAMNKGFHGGMAGLSLEQSA